MTYFLKRGNTFNVSTKEAMDLHEKLPAGNYVIKKDIYENLFLEQIESFDISGKIYGDTVKKANRVLNTFYDRPASTGIMLSGEKGSGKTLLAKMITVEAAKKGIPTIVINTPWCGDKFNELIQMIEQECIVLFDEFEKVYDRDEQELMLTLLDGVFPTKKLFVLTCNDKWKVDINMRNRPGRIYYLLDFKGLSQDFIIEYCNDRLDEKKYIDQVCKIASVFDQFNFDMLKALVEEMNRYSESPQESMLMLNAKPEFSSKTEYTVNIITNGKELPKEDLEYQVWNGNPLANSITMDYRHRTGKKRDEWDWKSIDFSLSDLKNIDAEKGSFMFVNAEGSTLTLTKVEEKKFNYYDAF